MPRHEWLEVRRPLAMARPIEVRHEIRQKNVRDTKDPPHPQGLDAGCAAR